ncbi:hypothetical protein WJX74_007986 [Apatococcus lobatus]|uniref:Uncharacterized protein n=2 Tax=Apatococcus TaxID=904362 RepID=A0AAW1SYH0_9CHLO
MVVLASTDSLLYLGAEALQTTGLAMWKRVEACTPAAAAAALLDGASHLILRKQTRDIKPFLSSGEYPEKAAGCELWHGKMTDS